MLSKVYGIFTGSNGKNNFESKLKNLKLIGSLHKKVIGGKKEEMSDECTLTMSITNEKSFDYNIDISNDEYEFSSK